MIKAEEAKKHMTYIENYFNEKEISFDDAINMLISLTAGYVVMGFEEDQIQNSLELCAKRLGNYAQTYLKHKRSDCE